MNNRRNKNSPLKDKKSPVFIADLMEMEFPQYHPLAVIDGDYIVLSPPDGTDTYEISWRQASGQDPAEVLDWIYQVQLKTWATPEMVYDLITAFDVVLGGAQGWLNKKRAMSDNPPT